MSKYDSGLRYDIAANNGGLAYDFYVYREVKQIYDSLRFTDTERVLSVIKNMREDIRLNETNDMLAVWNMLESVFIYDRQEVSIFVEILEKLNIIDEYMLVTAHVELEEKITLSEQASAFNLLLQNDTITFSDDIDLLVLAELAEQLNFSELSQVFNYLSVYERFIINDRDTETAESDFYIGKQDGLDPRFNWLIPFEMLFDYRKSSIPVMPETESTYTEIAGVDGELELSTKYKNRRISLVAYSEEGLTKQQKQQLKEKIAQLLDETKHKTKRLTIQENNLSFDIKYSGSLETEEGPSFVKATIPFEASPYAYNQFEESFVGSGTIMNTGAIDVGAVIYVSEGCVNPHFAIDSFEFLWNGTVPAGQTLVIDNEDKTCYLVDDFGNQEQAMDRLERGQKFYTTPKNSTSLLQLTNTSQSEYFTTKYLPRFLWKG